LAVVSASDRERRWIMSKLVPIAILIAVLTIAAAATAGYRARPNHIRIVRSCVQGPVFPPGKNSTLCGPQVFRGTMTVWVRDPATGKVTPVPSGKWRTEVPPYGP
jgi:hypothetical protein